MPQKDELERARTLTELAKEGDASLRIVPPPARRAAAGRRRCPRDSAAVRRKPQPALRAVEHGIDRSDLPDLTMNPTGIPFHSGTFDPTKATPALHAHDSSGGEDCASANIYATIPGGIDLDGRVGFADLLILAQYYGTGPAGALASVPEPTRVIGLATMSLLALCRRKR